MITVISIQQLKKDKCVAMSRLLYLKQQLRNIEKSGGDPTVMREQVDQANKQLEALSAQLKFQTTFIQFKREQAKQQQAKVVSSNLEQTLDSKPSYPLLSIQKKAIQEQLLFYKWEREKLALSLKNEDSKLEYLGSGGYYRQESLAFQDYTNCLNEIRKLEWILDHSTLIEPDTHMFIQLGTYFLTTKPGKNWDFSAKNKKRPFSLLKDARQYLLLDEVPLANLTPKEGVDILTKNSLMGHMALGLKAGEELNGETVLFMQNAESMKYPVLQIKRSR